MSAPQMSSIRDLLAPDLTEQTGHMREQQILRLRSRGKPGQAGFRQQAPHSIPLKG